MKTSIKKFFILVYLLVLSRGFMGCGKQGAPETSKDLGDFEKQSDNINTGNSNNLDIGAKNQIDHSLYSITGDKVYYDIYLVETADLVSFEVLGEYYAKDKNYVYFELLGEPYAMNYKCCSRMKKYKS